MSPFMSILHGFAAARARDQDRTYRCDECGAVTRHEPTDNPPASVACWAVDGRAICTGRAVLDNPTSEAMADVQAYMNAKAAR